jgi:LacI family transcriptional regulator
VGGFNRDVTQPRLEGFQSVLDKFGFNPVIFDNPVSLSPWVTESAPFYYDAVREWIANTPRPLAVFTNTELAGFGMIEICRTSGLRVPEEIAVLSAGYDPNMASLSNPALSGIRLNRRRLGFEAGRILDLLLKDKSVPPETMLDPEEIVERDSTNFIAVQNELVKTALHFIGAKMDQNIKVSDLVKVAHTSRATLENRFREALGRTPLEEIHRQKIERIRQLLHSSNLSIGEIARQTGFRDQFHLSTLFKKKTGQTPSRYREGLRNRNTPQL